MMQEAPASQGAPSPDLLSKVAPDSPPAPSPGAPAQALPSGLGSRLLGVLVALALLVAFAVLQPPRGDPLAPEPALLSVEGFFAPQEENRWLRAGGQRPVFESVAATGGAQAKVASADGRFVMLSEDGGRRWRVAAAAEGPAQQRRPLQPPARQKAAQAPQVLPQLVFTALQAEQRPPAKEPVPNAKAPEAKTPSPSQSVQQRPIAQQPNAPAKAQSYQPPDPKQQQAQPSAPAQAQPPAPRPPEGYRILATQWLDTARGSALAVGAEGVVLRTSNGGRQWQEVRRRSGQTLKAFAVLPESGIVLALADRTIVRGDLATNTWQEPAYRKSPAPWLWVVLGAFALGAVSVARRRLVAHRSAVTTTGVLEQAVSDAPIDDAAKDRLAFRPVVEALSRFLRHTGTQPPLAIAVNARWGMGKSSFMAMLAGELRQRGARPVWFNVWHHQHEEVLLAPLLQAITQQAIPRFFSWHGLAFRARLVVERWRRGGWATRMGWIALLSVPAYLACLAGRVHSASPPALADGFFRDVYSVFTHVTVGPWLATAAGGGPLDLLGAALRAIQQDPLTTLAALGVVFLAACWAMLWMYLLRPFPARPAVLLSSLGTRFTVTQAEAQTDFRRRFRMHFGEVARALGERTMTIFIDDLDRCSPPKAAELLECVNYLCEAGPCFVILGTDRRIVEAQIASAHKALAEEQAAIRRAELGQQPDRDPVARESQAVLDRLAYARVYLRKLVQLDVKLPTLESARALDMLLGPEPEPDPASGPQAQPPQRGWRGALQAARAGAEAARPRIARSAGWVAGLLVVAGLLWQMDDTIVRMKAETQQAREQLQRDIAAVRAQLEDARAYEHWMRLKGGATGLPPELLASLRARADAVQGSVKAMEQALPLLEAEVAAGAPDHFESIRQARFEPFAAHARSLVEGAQPDGEAWPGRSLRRTAAVSEPAAADGGTAAAAGGAAGAEAALGETVWWPAGMTVAIVLALLAWGWARREQYVVHATPEYRAAVKAWQAQLMEQPETATPRELKRFLNISRYAVVRLRKAGAASLPEARVVELSARWLLARGSPPGELRRAMLQEAGGERAPAAAEVDAFLQIVGDLETGEGAAQAAPAQVVASSAPVATVPSGAAAVPSALPPIAVRTDGPPPELVPFARGARA
ncbi:MAG TPA: P-loop NTPase fold protein [Ramlibacter sp.]|uniref:P-loop NTPase fold protein n=1 Tax=Ramlibacter sp. TaxID=1917967 RepID=UPI002D801296|nr:P-loop NTPase fold protein [Ramlibacter sp.]HET8747288.1 P-loop NTPase fold protein [Ramlibacter sp.]